MDLQNQVIFITGAGSGMGAITAEVLAQAGALIAVVDIDHRKAQDTAKKIQGLALTCDVSDAKSTEIAVKNTVEHFGRLTGCVSCAGIAPAERIVGRTGPHELAAFSKVIQVNLIGTFNVMRLCAAEMLKQEPVNADGERGVIVNTASVAAYEGQIGQAAYSASKGGVVSLTLPAAREFGKFGVRVMTIAPGIMDTPMMSAMPDEVRQSLGETVTFPKRLGHAQEFARLVREIFENTYLNGSIIRLDGAIRMASK